MKETEWGVILSLYRSILDFFHLLISVSAVNTSKIVVDVQFNVINMIKMQHTPTIAHNNVENHQESPPHSVMAPLQLRVDNNAVICYVATAPW